MDTVNLTALLRPSLPSNAHLHASSEGDGDSRRGDDDGNGSRSSDTGSHAPSTAVATMTDAASHTAKAHATSTPRPSTGNGGTKTAAVTLTTSTTTTSSNDDGDDEPPYPLRIQHRPSSDDSVPLCSYWEALLCPEVYLVILKSLRITLMVALPLALLTRLPSVSYLFPAHVVMPLWAIVDCRFTVGEQLAALIVSMQCAVWMMAFGATTNAWGLVHSNSAWWCVMLTTSFVLHLFGDVRCKRVVMLQSIIILQMQHLPGGDGVLFPVRVGCDMLLSTAFAAFQCLFPPRSVARECDELLAQGWAHCRNIMHEATFAFWSDDPIAVALALNRVTSEPMQRLFAALPGRLFFVTYEFWESTLRLELRRERLQLMQRLMAPLLALTDAARSVAMQKSARSQYYRERRQQRHGRHDSGSGSEGTRTQHSSPTDPAAPPLGADDDDAGTPHANTTTAATPTSVAALQSHTYSFGADDRAFWQQAGAILRPALDHYMCSIDAVFDALGRHLDPADTVAHVPFDALQDALDEMHAALTRLNADMVIKSDRIADAFLYTYTLFFHLMLVPIARRLLEYGASMQQFDRRRYKSQWQRTLEFFVLDYWRAFWDELPRRLRLATPRDVRLYKDALKLSLAYGVGVMFTMYLDRENVYYFGMAILMAVGLPTAGDTMVASVYRVTGMLCACSLAYVAVWHTANIAGEIALTLCGVFLSLLMLDSVPYNHIGQYSAMLLITSLNSASIKLQLLSRIICNCMTVMAYYAIVVFVFPINVHDVALSHNVEALVAVVNGFSDVVHTVLQDVDELGSSGDGQAQLQLGLERSKATCARTWAQLNVFGQWIPKAAAEPAAHGMPYPMETIRNMYSSMRRLASATEMIVLLLSQLVDARTQPARRRDVLAILCAVAPVLRQVEARNRAVVRSLILAMTQPHTWSLEEATTQFASFLQLSTLMQRSLFDAQLCTIQALRRDYADRVFNRTIAFVTRDEALSQRPAVGASVQQVTEQLVPVQPWPRDGAAAAAATSVHNGSMRSTTGAASADTTTAADRRRSATGIGAATPSSSTVFAPANTAQGNNSNNSNSNDDDDNKDGDAALRAKLHAIGHQAEQQVYSEMVARRESTLGGGRLPCTVTYDASVTLCVVVATDIFFIEAERLLKTAMVLNQYARSRVTAPRTKRKTA